MHKIDGYGATVSNTFTEGDPGGGVPPTRVTKDWLNAVQGEVCNAITASGLPLIKAQNDQLAQALKLMYGQRYRWFFAPTNAYTTLAAFTAGTYVNMGEVPTTGGNLKQAHNSTAGGGRVDSSVYSILIAADEDCDVDIYCPCCINQIKVYHQRNLVHTWDTSDSPTTPFTLSLVEGDNLVQFLLINSTSGSDAAIFLNAWYEDAPVKFSAAAGL